nr:O-antigen ligase family protein [uncultured Gellertiella sp.]
MQMTPAKSSNIVDRFYTVFASVYIASSMGWATVILLGNTSNEGANSVFRNTWLVLYALNILFYVLKPIKIYRADLLPLFFVGLVVLSTGWSLQREQTLTYGGALAFNVLFCMHLSKFWSREEFLRRILDIITFSCVAGVTLWLLGWDNVRYVDVHDRLTVLGTEPLRGFFYHKIIAGLYSVFALMIALVTQAGLKRTLYCSILLVFLLLSGSSSALALLLVGLGGMYMYRGMIHARLTFEAAHLAMLVILVALITLAYAFLGEILEALGRDPTLTGRTLLWSWGLEVARQRPWFGWGYSGYLGSDEASRVARNIMEFRTYEVPHFHNSYIQMFVDIGLVGLLMVLMVPLLALKKYYIILRTGYDRNAFLFVSILFTFLVSAFFVHVFYKHNDFSAVFIFSAYFLSCVEYNQSKK